MRLQQASGPAAGSEPADTDVAFSAILAAANWSRRAAVPAPDQGYRFADGTLHPVAAGDDSALLVWRHKRGWQRGPAAPAECHAMLDLYLPVCGTSAAAPAIFGHLGQSLDGNVATASGDSFYVTGPDNLLHMHRMRALCDAVVVGAGTVAADDPRLTTRRAPGEHPVRVILDPRRRLEPGHGVFQDNAAPTLLMCDAARTSRPEERVGSAEVVGVPVKDGAFDLDALVRALHERGLYALFVEGGGRTVSAFLEAGLLDRLQVTVAPLITGSGRPGLTLAAKSRIADCLRPAYRMFAMGGDVLFDCDLRDDGAQTAAPAVMGNLSRVF